MVKLDSMAEVESKKIFADNQVRSKEVSLESVPGILNKVKRAEIEYFDDTKEIGGLILGYRDERGIKVVRLVQCRNRSRKPNFYKPGFFSVLLKPFTKCTWAEVASGITVIGEFHSDFYKSLALSEQDKGAIKKRCRMFGLWVVAVIVPKHRMIAVSAWNVWKINNKTIYKEKPIR
jgi:hypothetical protein